MQTHAFIHILIHSIRLSIIHQHSQSFMQSPIHSDSLIHIPIHSCKVPSIQTHSFIHIFIHIYIHLLSHLSIQTHFHSSAFPFIHAESHSFRLPVDIDRANSCAESQRLLHSILTTMVSLLHNSPNNRLNIVLILRGPCRAKLPYNCFPHERKIWKSDDPPRIYISFWE